MANRLRIVFGIAIVGAVVSGIAGSSPKALASVNWANPAGTGPFAFETESHWTAPTITPAPFWGNEKRPPGMDSTFTIQNTNVTVQLSQPRTGANALGAMSIGGGTASNARQITTLEISADTTFTGLERVSNTNGAYNTTLRHIRVGLDDSTPAPANNDFPWGVVIQKAGTLRMVHDVTAVADPDGAGPEPAVVPQAGRGEILLSSDKDASAGSVWEVGGTASLILPDDMRIGDRATSTSMPGAVFRVRGSQVGEVTIGNAFSIASDAGLWDAHRDGNNRLQFNRGKSVSEFVLDAGGVTPVTVLDNLDIGDVNSYPAGHAPETGSEYTYGFLRIKLSEPTTAGTGAVGSGNELVLFKANRITTDLALPTGTDYDEGRFFDPDRLSASGGPHRPLFDSNNPLEIDTVYRVLADYAGQQYSWRIDYFDSLDDGTVIDAVVLSELQITGVAGDLNGDNVLNESDRGALQTAIATPPATHYDLLGAKQHVFDLNADDFIDSLDLQVFNTKFLAPDSLSGDFNDDGEVDAADYTIWRDNLGNTSDSVLSGNGDEVPGVGPGDYALWKTNFGASGSGSGSFATAVPEPSTLLMLLVSCCGVAGLRRRAQ
jgi:hypothetical protein